MTKRILGSVVVFAWLITATSSHAHHSVAGAYALGKEAKIEGAFNSFRLVNPTVTFVPAFDGKSPVGLLRAITYPDGHTIEMRRGDDDQ